MSRSFLKEIEQMSSSLSSLLKASVSQNVKDSACDLEAATFKDPECTCESHNTGLNLSLAHKLSRLDRNISNKNLNSHVS